MKKAKQEPEKYYIHTLKDLNGRLNLENTFYREVKGESVNLPGHEDKDLFVHRNVNGYSGWTVSDGRTGLGVCFGKTKRDAVENLKELMEKPRAAALGRMIEEALQSGYRSPREETRH
jgi:hypothetical protein